MSSMALKLALGFTLLYVLCFAIGAAYYVNDMQHRLQANIDESLVVKQEAVAELYETTSIGPVAKLIQETSNNPMETRFGYHLSTLEGISIVGNIASYTKETGWQDVHASVLGFESEDTYRFYTQQLGNYLVSIGRSVRDPLEIRQNLLKSFVPTLLVSALLALLGGIFLAIKSHSRVRTISGAMDKVANGNLSARLPVSGRGDSIDRLSSNMNKALDLLQQQVEGMKQVSANMAHDLKTPLNRLYTKLESATAIAENCDQMQECLGEALLETDQINNTFEALLRIGQIEAGARKSRFTRVDLQDVLETVSEVYEAVAEESGQQLSLRGDDSVERQGGLYVQGDKALLIQMLVNIVENAIKHCPSGVQIMLSAGVAGNNAWVSVCDGGLGIPAAQRNKVFDRLYRLEASRTTEGAGLGLSLVKAVATLHNGSITLSDNQPGLCMKVTFASEIVI